MKPAKLDLPTIWRGCDWGPVILKWKDQNGQPINLSGWQPKAQSLNVDLQPVITDTAQGITQMALSRVDTANLRMGTENWDWIWERIAGQYRFPPFLAGRVIIKEPLTSTNGQHPIGPPPPNDNFADATEIQGENGNIEGTNVNATRETGEAPGEASVWYRWTPNRDKQAILQIGTNWLTIQVFRLIVQEPDTPIILDSLEFVAASSGDPSKVAFIAHVSTTYYIRLFKATRNSDFNLNWSMTALPP